MSKDKFIMLQTIFLVAMILISINAAYLMENMSGTIESQSNIIKAQQFTIDMCRLEG